jgi:anti-sigma regulatory factor (Ser/Thr protein kinase)
MRLLSELKLSAELSNLRIFVEFVSKCANEEGISKGRITEIGVATEEALVNICNYAYPDQVGEVQVICMVDDKDRFVIEIEDSGIPFNILGVGEPDLTEDIAERRVGSLGVFIIKKLMDEVHYRREDNKNIVKLIS